MIINYLRKYDIPLNIPARLFSTIVKYVVKDVKYTPLNPLEFSGENPIAKGVIQITKSDGFKYTAEKFYPLACSFQGSCELHELHECIFLNFY